jgi:hypothetical protein
MSRITSCVRFRPYSRRGTSSIHPNRSSASFLNSSAQGLDSMPIPSLRAEAIRWTHPTYESGA